MRKKNTTVALTRRGINALVKHQEPREEYLLPVADVFETPEAFILKLDMPGAKKDALIVSAEPLRLAVKGPVEQLHQDAVRIHVNEIINKTYYREFHLTTGLDHNGIQAKFEDGVLTITIPKTDDIKLKEIPIQ